jgi:hypothetical protein
MNRINAVLQVLHDVMRTSLRRTSLSWRGIAGLVASLAAVGLGSVSIRVAYADTNVPCQHQNGEKGLRDAIRNAPNGAVLSLTQDCIYILLEVDNQDPNLGQDGQPILGKNGLPVIKQKLTINGHRATITRISSALAFRIFQVNPGGDLTLNRVTVDNGNADGGDLRNGRGGGIYNLGKLTVTHSTLSHNVANVGGGGIGNGDAQETTNVNPAGGFLTLSDNSVVSGNSAGANGGGVASGLTSTMHLTRCTVSDNNGGPDSGGGGIANQGTATLNNCSVSGNTAAHGAGIISIGHLILTDSDVTDNTATDAGGGILNLKEGQASGTANLIHSHITGNSAANDSGGIGNLAGATATLIHSPVIGNSAANNSGGIGNAGGMTLIHSHITANSAADNSGGIGNAPGATVTLIHSPVTGNSAANDGGGVGNAGGMTLIHSRVTRNNAGHDGGGIANELGGATIKLEDHSDVEDNGALDDGGGIFNQAGNTVTLDQSKVKDNTPNNCSSVVPGC